MDVTHTQILRGIPLWLVREYLQELGGQSGSDGRITAQGWEASLRQLEDYQIGSLRVGQVLLEIRATDEMWRRLQPALEKKLLRGGG